MEKSHLIVKKNRPIFFGRISEKLDYLQEAEIHITELLKLVCKTNFGASVNI